MAESTLLQHPSGGFVAGHDVGFNPVKPQVSEPKPHHVFQHCGHYSTVAVFGINGVAKPSVLERSPLDSHKVDTANQQRVRLVAENSEPELFFALAPLHRLLQHPPVELGGEIIGRGDWRPLAVEMPIAPLVVGNQFGIGNFKKTEYVHLPQISETPNQLPSTLMISSPPGLFPSCGCCGEIAVEIELSLLAITED